MRDLVPKRVLVTGVVHGLALVRANVAHHTLLQGG
jgi:hypothetical protein